MDKIHKVLLVDDDNITNFINIRLIRKMGIAEEVVSSQNGAEALDYIKNKASGTQSCPELIFLDINMPVMNGFEFLEAFNSADSCTKKPVVVILTTSSNENDMLRLKQSALVSGFLNKPLTEAKMQEVYKTHFAA